MHEPCILPSNQVIIYPYPIYITTPVRLHHACSCCEDASHCALYHFPSINYLLLADILRITAKQPG
jgi:hypothetical protein